MCYVVSVGVRHQHEGALEPFRDAGFSVARSSNTSLAASFGDDIAAFEVTVGGCSCDLKRDDEALERRLRARYAARGWSRSKIARALEDHRHAARRTTAARPVVKRLLDEAGRDGCHAVRVASDPNAVAFYERLGAHVIGSEAAPMPGAPDRRLPVLELRTRT